jgi:ribosomal protein S18 acetylase RimI-like enzyme
MSTKARLPVALRPARPQDTPDVLELTSHIWDGDDYVPEVWQEWLEDPLGLLLVAEYQQRIVGLARLSETTPDDWWMQGLRVHPDFEGQGIASRLNDALLDYWLLHGRGALRLTTYFENYRVQHMCQRWGFEKVGQYSYFQAPALRDPALSDTAVDFIPVTPAEASEALAFSQTNLLHELALTYMDLGWEWLPPRLVKILAAIQRGQALWWQDRQGLLLFHTDVEEDAQKQPVPCIAWLACQLQRLPDLLLDFRRLAGQRGFANAGWSASMQEPLLTVLAEAGFERKWDGSVYLYEKKHPGGK